MSDTIKCSGLQDPFNCAAVGGVMDLLLPYMQGMLFESAMCNRGPHRIPKGSVLYTQCSVRALAGYALVHCLPRVCFPTILQPTHKSLQVNVSTAGWMSTVPLESLTALHSDSTSLTAALFDWHGSREAAEYCAQGVMEVTLSGLESPF